MPALTPAQRRRQIELQQQREKAAKNANKPKPGQKGVPSTGGSSSKSGTIGGGTDKPVSPRQEVGSGRSTSRFAGNRDREFNRVRNMGSGSTATPTKPPTPNMSRASGGTRSSTPTAKPAVPKKATAPASSKDNRVSAATANRASGNYGTSRTDNKMIDDWMREKMRQREGRDLTSKSNDYGSKAMSKQFASSGTSAKTDYAPKTKIDGSGYANKQPSNQTKTAYNSKTNLKPASPASPSSPAKANDKPDVSYESKTKVDGSKYSKKPTNNTQLAFKSKGAESLAEMMRNRRQGRT